MKRGLAMALALLIIIPFASSISLKELISKYAFSFSRSNVDVASYSDYMADKDGNGINDTLVIELLPNISSGNFIFAVDLFDNNYIFVNESNLTLTGNDRINFTFDSALLSQNQFNYSIKIYNSSYSLKYRKDNILTQNYSNYEAGLKIISLQDAAFNNYIQVNVTINSTKNGTYESTLFLSYNDSTISIKENKSINGISILSFNFDNETIKKTHYKGKFNISSLKIGKKVLRTNAYTSSYDFRNFAASSYIDDFSDFGYDSNSNGKYESLNIAANLQVMDENYYSSTLHLHDLFGNLVEIKNASSYLAGGKRVLQFSINGSKLNEKKMDGPFVVRKIELYANGSLIDVINNAYVTNAYAFSDFDSNLPDLSVNISVSPDYHYGISNLTINFSVRNSGSKPAFNVFAEYFDNSTFYRSNKTSVLNSNSEIRFQATFINASDFSIASFADSNGLIEESDENNNAQSFIVKINKKPLLNSVYNLTINETDRLMVNLSAVDPNNDNLSFAVNSSKFSNKSNIFSWQTSTTDSGSYTFEAVVSDGYLNDSAMFNVIILDNAEKDFDNDGVNDSLDAIIGDEKAINTSTLNITLLLNESSNLSRNFNGTAMIKLKDGNLTIAEFNFDFSSNKLNLTNLTINKQSGNTTGSVVVGGLRLPSGATKSVYVDRLNANLNGICIRDENIASISEISSDCNSNNEYKVECDGTMQSGYACSFNSTIAKYKVTGLKHSGVIQYSYARPADSSTSSSSSGSGGSSSGGSVYTACHSDWKCGEWSGCINGVSTRICQDENKCSDPTSQPLLEQECDETGQKPYSDSFIRNDASQNDIYDTKLGKSVGNKMTGAVAKTVSLDSYAGIFIALIGISLAFLFYLNKKYNLKH